MSFESAADIVDGLASCGMLAELLERDVQSDVEVGFAFGETGTVYEFREGSHSEMTFVLPSRNWDVDERRVVVHTHPSIDATMSGGVTVSESDIEIGDHPAVGGMIALSGEMFELRWHGEAVLFDDEGVVIDRMSFEVTAGGVRDGPAEERYVENPDVTY